MSRGSYLTWTSLCIYGLQCVIQSVLARYIVITDRWYTCCDSGRYAHYGSHQRCEDKGGTCANINDGSCNTDFTADNDPSYNIYKDGLCYSTTVIRVCCIPTSNVCLHAKGICVSDADDCLVRGRFFSWFPCNSTHRCCTKRKKQMGYNNHHGGQGGGSSSAHHKGHGGSFIQPHGQSYYHKTNQHSDRGYGGSSHSSSGHGLISYLKQFYIPHTLQSHYGGK